MWFDSLVYTQLALRQLVDAVGADRVVLGSDYPFDMGVTDLLTGWPPRVSSLSRSRRSGGENAAGLLEVSYLRSSTIRSSSCPTASSRTCATSTWPYPTSRRSGAFQEHLGPQRGRR